MTEQTPSESSETPEQTPRRRTRARKTAETRPEAPEGTASDSGTAPDGEAPQATRRSRSRTKTAAAAEDATPAGDAAAEETPAPRKRTRKKAAAAPDGGTSEAGSPGSGATTAPPPPVVVFQPPDPSLAEEAPKPKRTRARKTAAAEGGPEQEPAGKPADETASSEDADRDEDEPSEGGEGGEGGSSSGRRRRRGRRGRGRSKRTGEGQQDDTEDDDSGDGDEPAAEQAEPENKPQKQAQAKQGQAKHGQAKQGQAKQGPKKQSQQKPAQSDQSDQAEESDEDDSEDGPDQEGTSATRRRRRRRRRGGSGGGGGGGDQNGDTEDSGGGRDDEVRGIKGSTRMEAKRQRRREGRDSRRRPPVLTEAEFLARRESVERTMVVREGSDRTQIAVLEDGVLVEHYIDRTHGTSMIGNVYLGRVQNVLPSMEAAFVDIGKGRNAVLYAGEVNYDASALEGRPPRIEQALKSGQTVLVQVTKDPIGHKGARLTSQISLPGRFMVYVPEGSMTGISRKLPDKERSRLKGILKRITPEDAGVIIRTAAEGASEEDLERDIARLHAQWEDIQKKSQKGSAPSLIYSEPDLVIRVIRDIFNEDFAGLVVQGEDEWDTVEAYISHVAPDLRDRLSRWTKGGDVFAEYRVDEQLAKALDRKVWLPSGGSLVIDRTEAMTVVDVNTGKFTGSGGNLEETVTRNNLEAAEEIVRQLRLRDIGGIIVIDFIDMVLESNRELVLRRLVECLGRDRTKHQVAEVTSLGLVQMTRKRVGQGLLEAFSKPCEDCSGRGVKVTLDPFEPAPRTRAQQAAAADDATGADEPVEVEERPKRSRSRRSAAAS